MNDQELAGEMLEKEETAGGRGADEAPADEKTGAEAEDGGTKAAFREIVVRAPLAGTAVSLKTVKDPTFAGGILGKGVAIQPSGNRVVSPVNGTVVYVFETGHAVGLASDDGAEVLIHVGLDTVNLQGRHFTVRKTNGDRVSVGDVILEFDREAIAAEDYDVITPVIVSNYLNFREIEVLASGPVKEGDVLLRLR